MERWVRLGLYVCRAGDGVCSWCWESLGKKMAMAARKIDAVTVIDVIRHRYQSDALANISAVIIVLFFSATMVAQFVGGAKLFEAVTGYSYMTGLVLFGLVVVIYTTIGGFRGVE